MRARLARGLAAATFATIATIVVLAAAVPANPAHAQVGRLTPVDDGANDPGWQQFRKQLLAIVERRDVKRLVALLDPNIRNSMGAKPGVRMFVEQWALADKGQADSPLWRELRLILELGPAWMEIDGDKQLCAPYVAALWPAGPDAFDFGAVTVKQTLVQTRANALSPALATLSYDIVRVLDWEVEDATMAPQKWVRVEVREGTGFVPEEHIRGAFEARACFQRGKGGWRITSLLVGN